MVRMKIFYGVKSVFCLENENSERVFTSGSTILFLFFIFSILATHFFQSTYILLHSILAINFYNFICLFFLFQSLLYVLSGVKFYYYYYYYYNI
jgi:hypothetical protein